MTLSEVFTSGLLKESAYMIPFIIACLTVIVSFWKDTMTLLAATLGIIAVYVWANSAVNIDGTYVGTMLELARSAFGLVLIVYLARRIGNK